MSPYYQDEFATIYHGDCRSILPSLGRFDLCLTDPPYGIAHSSNYVAPTTTAIWMNSEIANDSTTSVRDEVISMFDEWACFGSHKTEPPKCTRGMIVWDKGPASGMGDLSFPWKVSYEFIYIAGIGWSGSRDEGVIKGKHIVTRASMGRSHPNEKPVSLISYLISKHTCETIIDPFMGSGTTLVAAKQLGRKSVGIELEERYCEIAANRLAHTVKDLFAETPIPRPAVKETTLL
jgi:DNA modification methylase